MAEKIIWRNKARLQFDSIINYLLSEWGEKVTANFVERTYEILDTLTDFPELGSFENAEKQIGGFVITKHNTLFYRIEGKQIILLNFFDNRQNPKKRSEI
jgi:plasmid stabilization system protein ParE